MIFRLGELFCGAGGMALGAISARIDDPDFRIVHSWANDIDPDACSTYVRNICPDNPESVICMDVKDLDIDSLGDIDGFAFGFPCNDFSLLGEKNGISGKYGGLYSYGITVLKTHQPMWFVAENVNGLKSADGGLTFEIIKKDMINAGYRIYPHLYKAEQYGIPQTRHRIIVVGIRDDLPYKFELPKTDPYAGCDVSSRSALENPPIPADAPNNDHTKQTQKTMERLKHIRPGENIFTADLPDHLKMNVKNARISQLYKKLDPTKPAYTVIGSGGGGMKMYHYAENRCLTNRERARLQTFPDDFVFSGNNASVRKQIGMAVPPKLSQIIFESVLCAFAKTGY